MENASKALIMAGSVLITIIIISLLILMVNGLTSYQQVNNQLDKGDVISQFNSQYEKYNRDSVRGSDLVSLANKVIDYNRRKSTDGTVTTDGGFEIGYHPMTLTIKMGKNDSEGINNLKELIYYKETGYTHIFTSPTYAASATTNTLGNTLNNLKEIENKYTSDALTKFVSGINKVFIGNGDGKKIDGTSSYDVTDDDDKKDMIEAINNFNSCYGRKILLTTGINEYQERTNIENSWKSLWGITPLKEGSKTITTNVKEDVYKYYEYVLFKRGSFECTKCEILPETGRIYNMEFVFTGQFNVENN